MIYCNYNKLIEGQSIHSYKYNAFRSILSDDNVVSKENKDRIENNLKNENLAYNIYINDYVKQRTDIYDKTYENYTADLKNFTKSNKYRMKHFSNDQLKLFNKKYDPSLLTVNDYNYVDKDDYIKIFKGNKENELGLPGIIDKLNGKVINNMIKYTSNLDVFNNASYINTNNNEFCCNYNGLNIENTRILNDNTLSDEQFRNDVRELEVKAITDLNKVTAYNYPYYTYMRDNNHIFDPLYKNYKKTRKFGSISL